MSETIQIEDLTQWSPVKRVNTYAGPKNLRTGLATEKFWQAWKSNKAGLKAAGISCKPIQNSEQWEICHWAPIPKEEVEAANAAIEASRAVTADVVIPAPEGLDYLPFQRAGIAYMKDRQATLLADQMGLGKTVQAIGVMNIDETIQNVLIIVPASLKVNWRNELVRWLVRPSVILTADGKPSVNFSESFIRFFALHDQERKDASKEFPDTTASGNCPVKQISVRSDSSRMQVSSGSSSHTRVTSESVKPFDESKIGLVNTDTPPTATDSNRAFAIENTGEISAFRGSSRRNEITAHSPPNRNPKAANMPLMLDSAKGNAVLGGDGSSRHSSYIIGKTGFPDLSTNERGKFLHVLIVNYDLLQQYKILLDQVNWSLLIADEAHFLKNQNAKRTQLVLGCSKYKEREARPGIAAKRRLFLTGTPILNRPIEIFPLLHALDKARWSNKMKFALRYCAAFQGRWGWDMSGASNLEELQIELRKSLMLRRLKKDVLTELPDKRRQIVEIAANGASDLVEEEMEAYQRHEATLTVLKAEAAAASLGDDEAAYRSAAERLKRACTVAFNEIAKMRHQVALAKAPHVIEHVRGILDDGVPKCVIFAHHLDVHQQFAAEFGDEAVMVTGETPQDKRQGIIDKFNADPAIKVLLLATHAAGVGLSVKASVEVFAELDFVPGIISQAEDRCHGIGRGIEGEPLLVQHLVLEGSLDARMVKIIVCKQEIADKALDKGAALLVASEPVLAIEVDSVLSEPEEKVAVSDELRAHVHAGLRQLAACDQDHAAVENSIGFSKFDGIFGHKLAECLRLGDRQTLAGAKLCRRYRRQLGDDFAAELARLMPQNEQTE